MYKYTVEGLAEAEQTEAVQAATPDKKVDAQGQYEYELKGVVVHSGTAFAGHYYSYIKVCLSFTSACSSCNAMLSGAIRHQSCKLAIRTSLGHA